MSSFAQTLVREIVTYGVLFASVFEGHVNMSQEMDCKSDVTRNNVENKHSSGNTSLLSDVNEIVLESGCCVVQVRQQTHRLKVRLGMSTHRVSSLIAQKWLRDLACLLKMLCDKCMWCM